VAAARSIDIQQARQRVQAARGQYERNVEAIFPIIAPSIAVQHLQGVNQNANGTLALANFTNIVPAIAVQWIINPGQVVFDIIASKRRLEASGEQERAVELETQRLASVQYYDLVLAQQQVAVTRQGVEEAQELERIEELRLKSGTGLPADKLRADAALAGAQQDFLTALDNFYQASVALTLTLHLDPIVTLVPRTGSMNQTTLVRDDLPIEQLLATAVEYRPDLAAVRTLLKAAKAGTGSVVWGGLGPQFQASYSYGGLQTHESGQSFAMHQQEKAGGSAGFALGASTFGQVKTARANEQIAALDVESQLDHLRATVVSQQQASLTAAKLVPVAAQEVAAADEALRLAQTNLQAGTLLTLDVLQAQATTDRARLHYATAVVRYNQSQVNLLASLGISDNGEPAPPAR
jgi:outer membrane protein TolC